MKKFIIGVCASLLLFLSTSATAQSTYQIYVHDVDSQRLVYQVGETVNGTFILSNLSEIAQSDVYYKISSGMYSEENLLVTGEYSETDKKGPFYIKANSKDTIPFTYTLPPSLSGSVALHITAVLKDGTLVGESDYPLTVEGQTTAKPVSVIDSILQISGVEESIPPLTGPTVYPDETIDFSYAITSSDEAFILRPILKLYDRVDNSDALKKTIQLDPIAVGTDDNMYTMSLPTDLEPLVYYGVVSFEDEQGRELFNTPLRYIIAGPIGTVRNITTETLEVKKGDTFDVQVSYGGQPIDEFRPSKQIVPPPANITVIVTNEIGEVVATVTQPLNLQGDTRTLDLSLTAQVSAQKLSFKSNISTVDGTVLDEYTTTLPTEDDVKNQELYKNKSKFTPLTIITLVILLGLILIIVLLKRKYNSFNIPLTVIAFGMLLGLGMFSLRTVLAGEITSEAQDYLDSLIGSDGGSGWKVISKNGFSAGDLENNWFNVTSVSSPLPPKIKIYEPGEKFTLKFSATYADCNNEQRYYQASVYSPTVAWWRKSPSYIGTNSDFSGRIAYWNNNGVKLLDWKGGDSWEELFRIADLKVVAEVSGAKEKVLKSLVSLLNIDEYCPGRTCLYGGESLLRISLYKHVIDPDDVRGHITWIKDRHNRITEAQKILYDAGVIGDGLGKYDFSNTTNLKYVVVEQKDSRGQIYHEYVVGNQYTKTYFENLTRLKNEIYNYSQNAMDKFQVWFTQSEHARELLPVTLAKTYTAPTTPGYHLIHFYLMQDGVGGYKDITVRQTICVRGARVCPNENNRPVVKITKIDAITPTGANLTWIYTDQESDKQSNYQIDLSTEQSFTDMTKIKTFWGGGDTKDVSTIRTHIMTGLKPNTTYYVRIKGKAADAPYWSYWAYSTFKTLPGTLCDTSHKEDDKTCLATKELEYYCANGEWKTQETGNLCGGNTGLSCLNDNGIFLTTENAKFTVTSLTDGTYQWYRSDGTTLISGANTNEYIERFSIVGRHTLYAKFTKAGEPVKSASCSVNVDTCRPRSPGQCDPVTKKQTVYFCTPAGESSREEDCGGGCTNPFDPACDNGGGGGGGTNPVLKKFEFNPKIVKEGNSCPAYIEVENAVECSLKNRSQDLFPLVVTTGNKVSVTGIRFDVGTYTLYCKGTAVDSTLRPIGTRACTSVPDIKED